MFSPILLFVVSTACVGLNAEAAEAPGSFPPLSPGDTSAIGRNIQRTMRLLATSTPGKRNTVRILFYGQSITEQDWWRKVADDLRSRFPHANLVIENRALGGFASQMLVKTAETDLYPFQPDLLVFHVYGAHDKYEDIIRRVRERTTAEILQQNDHVTQPADLSEETDPEKLWPPSGRYWNAFMNHRWLPEVAARYGTELCDQRALWKRYLKEHGLEPQALLRDTVHLNPQGEHLMGECVKAYLRYDPGLGPSPAEAWVKTLEVGREIDWRDGALRVEFEGNRVDVVLKDGPVPPAAIRIDGRKPSDLPEVYGLTRALANPGGKWPVIAPIRLGKGLQVEDWTLEVSRSGPSSDRYEFSLRGARTGPDGRGRSDERFVSDSGRIVIETNDWNVTYAMGLAGVKPVPARFTVTWSVVLHGLDVLATPGPARPAVETAVTLAQGLPNRKHSLEISGPAQAVIAAVRIFSPPKR